MRYLLVMLMLAGWCAGATYYVNGSEIASGLCGAIADNTHLVLEAADQQADDYYNGYGIVIVAGTGAGAAVDNSTEIIDYDNVSNTVTISPAWSATPPVEGVSTYRITTGSDENTGGNNAEVGNAWATIDKAVNTSLTGAGPHTVYVSPATYNAQWYGYYLVSSAWSSKTVTVVKNGAGTVTIDPLNANYAILFYSAVSGAEIEWKDITISPDTSCARAVCFDYNLNANRFILNNLTITNENANDNQAIGIPTGNPASSAYADQSFIYIKNCIATGYDEAIAFTKGTAYGGGCIFVENSVFTARDSHVAAFGIDGTSNAYPIGSVVFKGNRVKTKAGSEDAAHGLLIGVGANGGTYEGNVVYNGDAQIVMKSSRGNSIINNTFYNNTGSSYGGTLKGTDGNLIRNNIFYGGDTFAFAFDDNAADLPLYNVVENNIFVGVNVPCIYFESGESPTNIINNNLYSFTGSVLMSMDGISKANRAAVLSYWSTADAWVQSNDSGSLVRSISISYDSNGWPTRINGLRSGENYGPVQLQPSGSSKPTPMGSGTPMGGR